jgi:hypothetical protein
MTGDDGTADPPAGVVGAVVERPGVARVWLTVPVTVAAVRPVRRVIGFAAAVRLAADRTWPDAVVTGLVTAVAACLTACATGLATAVVARWAVCVADLATAVVAACVADLATAVVAA